MRKRPTDILNKSQRSDATRRGLLLGSAAAWVTVLTGCATTSQEALEEEPVASEAVRRMYAAMPDEEFLYPLSICRRFDHGIIASLSTTPLEKSQVRWS